MLKRSLRTLTVLAAAAGVAAAASSAPAAAVAIGPNQYFVGTVNSHTASATIEVLCAGPASMGHPLANQTVGVNLLLPPGSTTVGYTGTSGNSIDTWLTWGSLTLGLPIAKFTSYGTMPISTGISVPCSGTGIMSFLPEPPAGARVSNVQVTFLNIGA
jgi:hypothetical protein